MASAPQAALTAHLSAVSLPAPGAVSPQGEEGWQHPGAQAAHEALASRHAWPQAAAPLQQHINLSSPLPEIPGNFSLNAYIFTPKNKKPVALGNQQLKSQTVP